MSTKLLETLRAQDQAELAERHNALAKGERKKRRSRWVIDVLRRSLPPHHVGLANRLLDLYAQAEGIAPSGHEPIDGGRNNREAAMQVQTDALRALHGYEAAVRGRHGDNGARCLWAIVGGSTWVETLRATRFKIGNNRGLTRLVQVVMLAADDYDEGIRAQRQASRGGP